MDDLERQIRALWDAGDAWRDVMPLAEARGVVREVIGQLDHGEVRVAEVRECFEQAGIHAGRVVRFLQKRVKQIRAFQICQITDRLFLAAGVEVLNDAIQSFGSTHAIQGPIEREPHFFVLLLQLIAFDKLPLVGRGEARTQDDVGDDEGADYEQHGGAHGH